jgi:RNA polymerase sigma-70 factor, ECF subfamily
MPFGSRFPGQFPGAFAFAAAMNSRDPLVRVDARDSDGPTRPSRPRLTPVIGDGSKATGVLDVRALGEALQGEAPILLAAARAIVLDEREAEDLVQVTFEIAIRRIGDLREPAALRSWLLTIQAREAFRVRRRLRRVLRFDPTVAELRSGPGPAPDDIVLRDALRRLPTRVRAAVVLHHLAGLPVADVAAALGTSPNTIKTQLKLGLQRLRKDLDDDRSNS